MTDDNAFSRSALELVAADGALVFRVSESASVEAEWCQVFFRTGDGERPLGAEALSHLVRRISSVLVERPSELRWMFSLSERHASLYGRCAPEGWTLHLQDADAVLIATIVLSTAEHARWLERLVGFQRA